MPNTRSLNDLMVNGTQQEVAAAFVMLIARAVTMATHAQALAEIEDDGECQRTFDMLVDSAADMLRTGSVVERF